MVRDLFSNASLDLVQTNCLRHKVFVGTQSEKLFNN